VQPEKIDFVCNSWSVILFA